ncbi:MAG: helix-turn-helix domain-containing protein [Pseudomonadota bacterium]
MPKLPAHTRVKRHAVYTVAEAAEVTGMHRQTVVRWIRHGGLPAARDARPWLISGGDLKDWLLERRAATRCTLAPREIYCLACRAARQPYADLVEERRYRHGTTLLIALCPCGTSLMHRVVRDADLPRFRAALAATPA